jgi:hypothetical protein
MSVVESPNEDEEVGLAILYDMFKHLVVDNGGNVAGNVDAEVPLQIPDPEEMIHIPGGDGEAAEVPLNIPNPD